MKQDPSKTDEVQQKGRPDGRNVESAAKAPSAGSEPTIAYSLPGPAAAPEHIGRYVVESRLGEGGMGIVYRCLDPDLNRFLAVKVLKGGTNADLCRRFLEEAQVMGHLQHPGVAPIHEIGALEDGRRFFSMKQIQGRTLADLLKERSDRRRADDPQATGQPPVASDLPRFLGIFEQICQTLAFAHSQGIIHRDLKPANIMVGAFGEVQVMDWGLAKKLQIASERENNSANLQSEICNLNSELTQAGSAMGTPGYLAPEQARGESASLDQRADVFGLGAILSVILTGKPPFWSKHGESILDMSRRGAVGPAFRRLDQCGADAELIDLCKKCLAANKEDRPADAAAVAAAVNTYQDGVREKLQQATLEKAQAQTRAIEERKRRRVSMTLAGVGLLFVLAVSGGLLWYFQDRAEQRLSDQLRQAEQRLAEEQRQRHELQAEEKITSAANKGEQELNQLVAMLLDPRHFHKLMSKPDEWGRRLAQAEAQVNEAAGVMIGHPRLIDSALRQRAESLQKRLAEERRLLAIAMMLDQARLKAAAPVGGRFDPAAAIPEYRRIFRDELHLDVENGDPRAIATLIRDKSIRFVVLAHLDHWALGVVRPNDNLKEELRTRILTLGRLCDVPDPWRDRFRDICEKSDNDQLLQLVTTLKPLEQNSHVVAAYAFRLQFFYPRRSHALFDFLSAHYLDDFWLQCSLGLMAEEPSAKIGFYRAALAVRESSIVHTNLGAAYYEGKNGVDKAIAHYTRAIDLDRQFAMAHSNLGQVYTTKKELDKAIAHLTQAIYLDPRYAKAQFNLGHAYQEKKDLDKAIAHYARAIDLDPRFAEAHNNLGQVYYDKKEPAKAIDHYLKAIDLDSQLGRAHYNLGVAYHHEKDLSKAIAYYMKALDLDPNYSQAHNNLGLVYRDKKEFDKAIAHLSRAVDLDPKSALVHDNLGLAYADKKELAKAIAHYTRAIALDAQFADAHYHLGNAYLAREERDKAIGQYQSALKINSKFAEAHCHLGLTLAQQGKFTAALKSLKVGHELGTRQGPQWLQPSALWVQQCEQFIQLENKLQRIADGKDKPKDAQEMVALASLCQLPFQQRYFQAAKYYQEAFQAEPMLVQKLDQQHRYNAACAAALAGTGQGKDAKDLKVPERARLREQAREWLGAELDVYLRNAQTNPKSHNTIAGRLQHWQNDPDLAGVRDPKALEKLADDEQKRWKNLWADHQQLLRKVSLPK